MVEFLVNFFVANGYGIYIWPCYVLLFLLISWQLIRALRVGTLVRKNLIQSLQNGFISD